MTNEEAIKYFKDPMSYTYEGIPVNLNKDEEAIELAIAALEKQTLKKPHFSDTIDIWECDNCNKQFDWHQYNFCPNCGQAAYWGEE